MGSGGDAHQPVAAAEAVRPEGAVRLPLSRFPSTNAHSITSSAMASIVARLLQRLRAPVGRPRSTSAGAFSKAGWNISADPDRGSPPLA